MVCEATLSCQLISRPNPEAEKKSGTAKPTE
jgi:hypothetical protein